MAFFRDWCRWRAYARALGIPLSWWDSPADIKRKVSIIIHSCPPRASRPRLDFRSK